MKTAIFTTKPVNVEALQFQGWASAKEAWEFANAFYVPRGHEHYMRTDKESDRSTGHILEDAQPYAVVILHDGEPVRVNVGDWIVKDQTGHVFKILSGEFSNQFQAAVENPSAKIAPRA